MICLLLTFGVSFFIDNRYSAAQENEQIQVLTGKIEPGEIHIYQLPDLKTGQVLYIYATATSGNLDPIVVIADSDFSAELLEAEFEAALDEGALEGSDPVEVINEVRDQFALAWDDDSGGGLTSALKFEIPADGDYLLTINGSLTLLGNQTFGDYEMLVGLNAPKVLKGTERDTGDPIAFLDVEATPIGIGVQELTGTLTPEKTFTFVELNDFKEGDTLYAYLETTSGDLLPTLVLSNFASKPVRSANLDGKANWASLQYTFLEDSKNYRLEIRSFREGESVTSGDYRLLVGANAPEVLTGEAQPEGRIVAREPIEVGIGFILEQIIDVDPQTEFFSSVSTIQMEWNDPALAFNPESCQCDFKIYSHKNFDQFLTDSNNRWPDFSFLDQQGNRWTQNINLTVFSNGDAKYQERFTTNFAVDFDFRQFPFDTQEFKIRIESIFPEEFFIFKNLENVSAISSEHGEDEYLLEDMSTEITSVTTSTGETVSRYIFSFEGPRHLSYYIFRIFVPILLIVLISWVTFFLKNYTYRIEVASANLLLFIAFSFSLAENYPRLGYLTFLDAVMAILFIINALVIIYNVWLRRLEINDKVETVERIDNVLDWVYPLIYVVLLFGLVIWFF